MKIKNLCLFYDLERFFPMITGAVIIAAISMTALELESPSARAAQSFDPPKPSFEYLGRWTVDLNSPAWELGQTSDLGRRRIIPITGGTFEGPAIRGTILNNGADWQVITKDGVAIIDTRYLLQTVDGALIYLQTKGYRYGPQEIMAKLARGEAVDPNLYYFRVTMPF